MYTNSVNIEAGEGNPRRMTFWFLFVSRKQTIHQNDERSLTSSFSAEPMLRALLKYSNTSETPLG
jgi:hypothetical protein